MDEWCLHMFPPETCLLGIAGDLSVQVEDHALLLHGLEDWVIDVVALDTRLTVGRDAARVRFNSYCAKAKRVDALYVNLQHASDVMFLGIPCAKDISRTANASLGSLPDLLGCQSWVEVKRHEESHLGSQLLKLSLVGQSHLGVGDCGLEVGL